MIPQAWVNWIHYDSKDKERAEKVEREAFRVDFLILVWSKNSKPPFQGNLPNKLRTRSRLSFPCPIPHTPRLNFSSINYLNNRSTSHFINVSPSHSVTIETEAFPGFPVSSSHIGIAHPFPFGKIPRFLMGFGIPRALAINSKPCSFLNGSISS